jgi:hypothetical protein
MTNTASAIILVFLFVLAGILISEWAHQKDRAEVRPRLVRTIMIDTDTEIERQENWR